MNVSSRRPAVSHDSDVPNNDVDAHLFRLEHKVKSDKLNVDASVLQLIAHQSLILNEDPITLFMRVMAHSSITKKDISVGMAHEALESGSVVRRYLPKWRFKSNPHNAAAGVAEGFGLAVVGLLAMLLTSALIDDVCHQMKLITLSVQWLWWLIIVLNALTVFIPFDIVRYFRRKRKQSRRFRFQSITLTILSSVSMAIFLVLLFKFQTVDVTVFKDLGFLD